MTSGKTCLDKKIKKYFEPQILDENETGSLSTLKYMISTRVDSKNVKKVVKTTTATNAVQAVADLKFTGFHSFRGHQSTIPVFKTKS